MGHCRKRSLTDDKLQNFYAKKLKVVGGRQEEFDQVFDELDLIADNIVCKDLKLKAKQSKVNVKDKTVDFNSTAGRKKSIKSVILTQDLVEAKDNTSLVNSNNLNNLGPSAAAKGIPSKKMLGLLNKVSQRNIAIIVQEFLKIDCLNFEKIFSRLVLDQICQKSVLDASFINIYAVLITALYKFKGPFFATHVLCDWVEYFNQYSPSKEAILPKNLANLIVFLGGLYYFQFVSYVFMFDLVHSLLKKATSRNVELLLLLIRNCGSQLRFDDVSALKEIVQTVEQEMSFMHADAITLRHKFLLDSLKNLRKTNNVFSGSSGAFEQSKLQLKAYLSNIKVDTLPLCVTLQEINLNRSDTNALQAISISRNTQENNSNKQKPQQQQQQKPQNLILDLAKKHHMNTDIRRAIFIAIMGSEDYIAAIESLMRLNLKSKQSSEIVKVLVYCCQREKKFNPFYFQMANLLCSRDHRFCKMFRYALWDFFKIIGEFDESSINQDLLETRPREAKFNFVSNTAFLYAKLILANIESIVMLNVVSILQCKSNTLIFVEILLIRLFLEICNQSFVEWNPKHTAKLALIMQNIKNFPVLEKELKYFLQTRLAKSSFINQQNRKIIESAIKDALNLLEANPI